MDEPVLEFLTLTKKKVKIQTTGLKAHVSNYCRSCHTFVRW